MKYFIIKLSEYQWLFAWVGKVLETDDFLPTTVEKQRARVYQSEQKSQKLVLAIRNSFDRYGQAEVQEVELKAWKTWVKGWKPSIDSIIKAESRNQARYITLRQARKAGYDVDYIDIKAQRTTDYDSVDFKPWTPQTPEYVERLAKPKLLTASTPGELWPEKSDPEYLKELKGVDHEEFKKQYLGQWPEINTKGEV